MIEDFEILEELDPEWRDHFGGSFEHAWDHYSTYAPEEIARIRREYLA